MIDLRGEDRSLALSVAWRYLRGHRSRLLAGTARAALLSTGIGVAAMVVAMALMSGYTQELQSKILGSGAIIAYPQMSGGSLLPVDEVMQLLTPIRGVDGVVPVVFAQGSIASDHRAQGLDVTVRGVAAGTPAVAGSLLGATESPPVLPLTDGLPAALLGVDLASRLRVSPGDRLRLVTVATSARGPDFEYRTLEFAGTFRTGFAEYDRHWVILDRKLVAELSGSPGLYEIGVERGYQTNAVRDGVEAALGERFLVTDWEPHNRELFSALRLQKLVLFLILGLIVLVSTFNVASTLIVMVRERMKEVGLLSALGLRRRQLELIFVLCGTTLGLAGTTFGVLFGAAVSWFLTTYRIIRFDADVAAIYFISSVPFRVEARDVGAVVLFSVGVTLLACWLPARQVARTDPAQALRYE